MNNDKKPVFNDLKANSNNIFESDDKKAITTSQSGVKALFNSLKDGNELDRSGTSNEGGEPKTLHEVKKTSESGPIAKFNQTDDVGNGRSESSRLGAESVLSAFRRASDAGFDGDRSARLETPTHTNPEIPVQSTSVETPIHGVNQPQAETQTLPFYHYSFETGKTESVAGAAGFIDLFKHSDSVDWRNDYVLSDEELKTGNWKESRRNYLPKGQVELEEKIQTTTPTAPVSDIKSSDKLQNVNSNTNKQLHTIKKINSGLELRENLKRHGAPVSNALAKPAESLQEAAKGDEETKQGLKKVSDYTGIIPEIMGGVSDDAEIESLVRSISKREADVAAGDALESLALSGKLTKDYLTNGDYAAYRSKIKHPELPTEDLLKIKQNTEEKNGRIILSDEDRRHQPKPVREMERALQMNQAETYAETLVASNADLFTEVERSILHAENSLFRFDNLEDFKSRDDLIRKILSNESLIKNDLAKLDWKKMSHKDIARLLQGKKGIIIDDNNIRGLVEILMENKERMCKISEIAKRKSGRKGLKGVMMERLVANPLMENQEFSQTTGIISKTVQGVTLTGKVVAGTGKLTYQAGRQTGKLAGKATIKAARVIDANEVADTVLAIGEKYTNVEHALKKTKDKVVTAPVSAIRVPAKGAAFLGNKIVSTDAYKKIAGSSLGKGFGFVRRKLSQYRAIGRRVFTTITTPFRAVSGATNFLKKKILFPIAVGGGGLLIAQVIIGFLAGGSATNGAGGSLVTIILDEDEHFTDFQAKYDEQDGIFQAQVDNVINSPAQTKNLKGDTIYYGINKGEIKNADGTITLPAQYQNGLHLGYYYDGDTASGISSNIEDILSAMAVIMAQEQSNYHAEALEFVEAAYKSTHSYMTSESPLYQCADGDSFTRYFCNEWKENYPNSDLRFKPWTYGEVVKPTTEQECVVHKAEGAAYEEYAGCQITGTCYHGEEYELNPTNGKYNVEDFSNVFWFDSDNGEHTSDNYDEYIKPTIVDSYPARFPDGYNQYGYRKWVTKADIRAACNIDESCNNIQYLTLYEYTEWTDDDGDDRTHWEACAYVAVCKGHNHYGCPDGHEIATCFGHTDLTMNIFVASLNKIFEMGGVTINETAENTLNDQIYGMNREDFEALSAEEQEAVMNRYYEQMGGN